MLFAAGSALDHVLDAYVWHGFETYEHKVPLIVFFNYHGKPYGISKYSILMAVAALLICAIYIPLAKKIKTGAAPTGLIWNMFEYLLTFVRDDIAKPYIGKDADKYVHFLWTIFLFVLFCNLFGMIPFLGSPTASFTVTLVLALSVFGFIHYESIRKYGWKTHLKAFAPDLDLPMAIKIPILIMLWPIEFLGLLLKCMILSVRLFANMFAGHIVLGTILLFIPMVRNFSMAIAGTVTAASVFGVFALSFLEVFVAFLQAYLFAFLAALFFGGILEHAEHVAHAADHGHGEDAPGAHGHEGAH